MKTYTAEKMFPFPDFPLTISRAVQRNSMVPHCHDFIEIVIISHGHTFHQLSDGGEGTFSYGLIQGDLFSILPGEVHAYSNSHSLVVYNLAFLPEIITAELPELRTLKACYELLMSRKGHMRTRLHLPPEKRREIEMVLKRMALALAQRKNAWRLQAKTLLLDFLLTIGEAEHLHWHSYDRKNYSGILKVLCHLETGTEIHFSLEKLARMANMSVSSFTKKFREMTGDSPLVYYNRLKLEIVRSQLAMTNDKSIAELALENGFCDSNYMIKLFRQNYGITPGRYRSLILAANRK